MQVVNFLLINDRSFGTFYGSGVPTCSLAARKSCLKLIGCFDNNFRRVEDADLAIRAGFLGFHFIGTKNNVFHQYSTYSNDKSYYVNLTNELKIVEKYKNYLDEIDYILMQKIGEN